MIQEGRGGGAFVEIPYRARLRCRLILRQALTAAGLHSLFDKLSYTYRKEHVKATEEAKQPETRKRRIKKALDMMGRVNLSHCRFALEPATARSVRKVMSSRGRRPAAISNPDDGAT